MRSRARVCVCIMKNKWNSGYTKSTNNGFTSEYFVLIS